MFISQNVFKNDFATKENIKIIRPNKGLDPKFFEKIIGMRFKKNLKKGTPLKLIHVKK